MSSENVFCNYDYTLYDDDDNDDNDDDHVHAVT